MNINNDVNNNIQAILAVNNAMEESSNDITRRKTANEEQFCLSLLNSPPEQEVSGSDSALESIFINYGFPDEVRASIDALDEKCKQFCSTMKPRELSGPTLRPVDCLTIEENLSFGINMKNLVACACDVSRDIQWLGTRDHNLAQELNKKYILVVNNAYQELVPRYVHRVEEVQRIILKDSTWFLTHAHVISKNDVIFLQGAEKIHKAYSDLTLIIMRALQPLRYNRGSVPSLTHLPSAQQVKEENVDETLQHMELDAKEISGLFKDLENCNKNSDIERKINNVSDRIDNFSATAKQVYSQINSLMSFNLKSAYLFKKRYLAVVTACYDSAEVAKFLALRTAEKKVYTANSLHVKANSSSDVLIYKQLSQQAVDARTKVIGTYKGFSSKIHALRSL